MGMVKAAAASGFSEREKIAGLQLERVKEGGSDQPRETTVCLRAACSSGCRVYFNSVGERKIAFLYHPERVCLSTTV